MSNRETVLFYFHEHNNYNHQLDTPIFRKLVDRAENVYLETVSDDQNVIEDAEKKWNYCISKNSLQENEFEFGYSYITVLRMLLGKPKRVVLERSINSKSFYHDKRDDEITTAFLNSRLEDSFAYQVKLLKDWIDYQNDREDRVARQISQLQGTTLVLFGLYHTRLADLISDERPVEVHYPYDKYATNLYYCQLRRSFKENCDKKNYELALRALGEHLTLAALRTNYKRWTRNEEMILANHYASRLSLKQILEFREIYLNEYSKLENDIKRLKSNCVVLREGLKFIAPYFKALEQICKNYNIPLPEELPKEILKGATWFGVNGKNGNGGNLGNM